MFKPFFHMESSRNCNTGGVVLGLSAARESVLEHGGGLEAKGCLAMGLRTGSGSAVAEAAGCDADYFFERPGHVALIEETASE